MSVYRANTNYYEILEVPTNAPQNEVHKAYQRAKATYSQDNPALYSMFSKDEARELVQMIEEAYAVLGNRASRRAYDQSLQAGTSFAPPAPHTFDSSATSASAVPGSQMAHANLPDLPLHESPKKKDTNPPSSGKPVANAKSGANEGMGRTPLSTYKIDESIESEIRDCTEFNGAFLHKVRTYKNVNIERLSESTRISRTYLLAVESDDYSALPAPVFVRGFVVQFARHLGLDETKVAAGYMKLFKAGLEK